VALKQKNTKNAAIKNIQRYGEIGVQTYITEFDINLNSVKGSAEYKSKLESSITYDMVRACIESRYYVSYDEFGITDKENLHKWLGSTNTHSYLFESRYRPKASYFAFRLALLKP
jgi:GH35 family endo-1,4-beta-xylanase